MKNVRNAKLRKILDKLGIKDIVLNFDEGSVDVWSDDELTDTILSYADCKFIYGENSFNSMSIDLWVDEIQRIFDNGLEKYENAKEFQKTAERDSNGRIVLHLGK